MANKEKNEYITCPVCGGSGKNKFGLDCSNCNGVGLGIFSHDTFFYWGANLGRAVIELDRLKKRFHLTINLISLGIAAIGLISLGFWAYLASRYTIQLDAFAFWRERNLLILLFWISIIADMFIIYRISQAEEKSARIKKIK